jgi:hypothetical protein
MRLGSALLVCLALSSAPDLAHLSLSPRMAGATTLVELSLAELVSKSNLVVAGTAFDSRSLWEESAGGRGRRIVTYTRLRIDRVIDGQPSGEIWVRTLGGHVDDIGQHVEGEAVLAPAKSSLLFLRALEDGTHGVVGMSQGQFPLDGTPVRLMPPPGGGRLLAKNGPIAQSQLPARLALSGQTLDAAARLVLAERRVHAP